MRFKLSGCEFESLRFTGPKVWIEDEACWPEMVDSG